MSDQEVNRSNSGGSHSVHFSNDASLHMSDTSIEETHLSSHPATMFETGSQLIGTHIVTVNVSNVQNTPIQPERNPVSVNFAHQYMSDQDDEESTSESESDSDFDGMIEYEGLIQVPAPRNQAEFTLEEYLGSPSLQSIASVWNLHISRSLRDTPIKESRLLLYEWATYSVTKRVHTPSMKLAYQRLRDNHSWLELPQNPPCILLPYKHDNTKQRSLKYGEYMRLGDGPLVHGFIQCYNMSSLYLNGENERLGNDESYHYANQRLETDIDPYLYLKNAPEDIKNNRPFMMLALHRNSSSLRWAGPNVLNCIPLMLYAIEKQPFSLAHAPPSLKRNVDIVKVACSTDPEAIEYADESIRGDLEFMRPLIHKDGHLLEFVTPHLADNDEIVMLAMRMYSRPLSFASDRLRDDRSFVYHSVKKDWEALKYASKRLSNDIEIAKLAMHQNTDALEHIGRNALKSCPEIMDMAIKATNGEIAFYKNYFKLLSKMQILRALELSPSSYENLPSKWKDDAMVQIRVLSQDWTLMSLMTHDVSHKLLNLWTIVLHEDWYYIPPPPSGTLDEHMIQWNRLRRNRSLLIAGIKKDRRIIQHASPSNKGEPRLVIEALKSYEDIGNGMVDPLCTAPYEWFNMKVLAVNLSTMVDDHTKKNLRNKYLSQFIFRFSNVYVSEAIGVSRVYRILKKNVDLFYN